MANEDILTQASTATQQMIPRQPTTLGSFGPAPMQMPPPMPHYQAPQLQFGQAGNEFQTVSGRKRADKEALFHGVASMIKSGVDYLNQKKDRALSMDLQTLMSAQQEYSEAQQILQSNPNDPQAQKILQDAVWKMNTITSDSKKSKQLQKAMNIDLFGGGKNKRENQVFINAWKDFQQKQQAGDKTALSPTAQRFMQAQPMRYGITPEMALKEQLTKSGVIMKAQEEAKLYQENLKTLETAKSAEDRTAAINHRSYIMDSIAFRAAKETDKRIDAYAKAMRDQYLAREDQIKMEGRIQELRSKDTHDRIASVERMASGKNEMLQKEIDAKLKIANDKNETMEKRVKAYQDWVNIQSGKAQLTTMGSQLKMLEQQRKDLETANTKWQAEIDKPSPSFVGRTFGAKAISDEDRRATTVKIQYNNKLMHDLDGQIMDVKNRMDNVKIMGQSLIPQNDPQSNLGGPSADAGTPINFNDTGDPTAAPPDNTDITDTTAPTEPQQ